MDVVNRFLVRGLNPLNFAEGDDSKAAINTRGDISVVQALPPRSELVRLGNSWQCSIATGSAFTHVAAWPTTRAELVFQNAEADGGKSYLIDSVWYANVATSVAAATVGSLIVQVAQGRGATPSIALLTNDTAQLITGLSGQPFYKGKGIRAVANTAFAIASKWEVVGAINSGGATATIGMGCIADVYGKYLVPPGAVFCINVALGTAVGTASVGFSWHEVLLPVAS